MLLSRRFVSHPRIACVVKVLGGTPQVVYVSAQVQTQAQAQTQTKAYASMQDAPPITVVTPQSPNPIQEPLTAFAKYSLEFGIVVALASIFIKFSMERFMKIGSQSKTFKVILPRKLKLKDDSDTDSEDDEDDEEDGEDGEDGEEDEGEDEEGEEGEDDDEGEDDEDDELNNTRLDDVAGIEEAKREVSEIIDFLKNPDVYTALGAKMPRGVLLSGPPGCGKTLLARAIAGEAGVPMIIASGSQFVEMFVGVGAQRVREMFESARQLAPCIIFIDEIDSIGRKRSHSSSAGNTEQDQTINQMLTEMDGFVKRSGVLVIAATNRPDMLDEALLRPGRFDRHVSISPPSHQGRIDILAVHTRNKPLCAGVNLESLARVTKGFSGAELENLCNEASIHAARKRRENVNQECFDEALDKVLLGIETGAVVSESQKRLISYHESGHVLMGILVNEYDVVRRVSIIPRGSAGGVTLFEPLDEDNIGLYTQQYLENQLIVALGGRVAEEIVFGRMKTTTGAYSDFQRVRKLAWSMITEYGFNQHLGQMSWADQALSGAKANEIDAEVLHLVEWAHTKATNMMQENESYLHAIASALLEKGVMTDEDLRVAVKGISCYISKSTGANFK